MERYLNILRVDASGRREGSTSRMLADQLVGRLESSGEAMRTQVRDLACPLPHVDEAWIQANFTPPEERSAEQKAALALSDSLVRELEQADLLIIGMPIYNFGVPAALKAWVDMIARARLTFRYTENGPVGLLEGKRAVLVVSSGGVAVDSDADFATPYMRQALNFVGISDIAVVAADRQNLRGEEAIVEARKQIDNIHKDWALPLTSSKAA